MKNLSIGVALGALLLCLAPASHAALFPPYNNTVALWLFDEGAGTNFNDATTNNNGGYFFRHPSTADVSFDTTVKQFGASSMNVVPQYSDEGGRVSDSASLDVLTNNFTVEGWWRLDQNPANLYPYMISRFDSTRTNVQWQIGINGANKIEVDVYDKTTGNYGYVRDPNVFPTGQWVHVAFTFGQDGTTNGVLKLWEGSSLIDTSVNANIHPSGIGRVLIGDGVGATTTFSGDNHPWRGHIDEIRLSDIVRVPGDGTGTNSFLAWSGSLIPEPAAVTLSALAVAWLLLPVVRRIRK